MKKCPYCAEEIQDEAIKCKHCGEFLRDENGVCLRLPPPLPREVAPALPILYRTSTIVVLLLTLPLLALPSIIGHPRLKTWVKLVSSTAIILLSWGLWILTAKTIGMLKNLLQVMESMQF